MGLATFHPYNGVAFDGIDDKDASIFPALVPGPLGRPVVALLRRPLFPGTRPEEKVHGSALRATDPHRESIWISYCRVSQKSEEHRLGEFVAHHPLAKPVAAWERLKVGGGAPPVMCRHGWLVIYHGVHKLADEHAVSDGHAVRPKMAYSAGAMVLSREHPNRIVYRSPEDRCSFPRARSSATA